MSFLKKKKLYKLINKKKYSTILLQKELEKLKNYIIVLIFKIWYFILRVPLKIKILMVNDAENLTDDIKSKKKKI